MMSSQGSVEEHPILVELRTGLEAQDVKHDCALKEAMAGARKADVAKWGKVSLLEEMIQGVHRELGKEAQEREEGEGRCRELIGELKEQMKEMEERLMDFAVNEAQKIIGSLLFNGAEQGTQGPSDVFSA